METVTAPTTRADTGARPGPAWLSAVRTAFRLAVQALEQGALPSTIPCTHVLLTREEFRAVLEAARTAVTRRPPRAMR